MSENPYEDFNPFEGESNYDFNDDEIKEFLAHFGEIEAEMYPDDGNSLVVGYIAVCVATLIGAVFGSFVGATVALLMMG